MCAEVLEAFGQVGTPEYSHVGLGRGTEVVECLQEAERSLCHLRASVVEASADGFGHPCGVAGEDVVVRLHAQVAHHAQLDDKLVDEFLCEGLVDEAVCQVVFNVDVEEGGNVAQRHGGTVLFLHGSQVGHVYPLYGFLCRSGGTAQVEAVVFAHHLDFLQGLDLLGHLFAQADACVGHGSGQVALVGFLGFNQAVQAVEGQTAVVADDASAGVVVGQAGKEAQRAERADFIGIYVKHSVVVCLAVVREDVFYFVFHFHTVFAACLGHYVDAAEGLDGAPQQFVGLQSDDEFVLTVDVAGLV